jgi:hypothetical protein
MVCDVEPTCDRIQEQCCYHLRAMMMIQSTHNLRTPHTEEPRPYGIRVSLKPNDPFRRLLGPDWHRLHWYHSASERDAALAEMSRRHDYSRPKDAPALDYSKIENLAVSRGSA